LFIDGVLKSSWHDLIVEVDKVKLNLKMNNDIAIFIISVGLLIIYLVFSALTEMGTKLPWKK
jgi:hypothetical protein